MRRRVWPPSRPSASSPSASQVEDDAALATARGRRPGASSTSTCDGRGAAEPAPGGDRVGGVARRRVAGLERRGQPALRPEAGALGERRAGDEADRGRRPRPRAAPSRGPPRRRRRRRRRTRLLWLSPGRLSADRLDLTAQPGGGGLARAGLLRRRPSASASAARRSASSTRFSAASACASISARRLSAAAIARSLASRSRRSSSSWLARSSSSASLRSAPSQVGFEGADLGGGALLGGLGRLGGLAKPALASSTCSLSLPRELALGHRVQSITRRPRTSR